MGKSMSGTERHGRQKGILRMDNPRTLFERREVVDGLSPIFLQNYRPGFLPGGTATKTQRGGDDLEECCSSKKAV